MKILLAILGLTIFLNATDTSVELDTYRKCAACHGHKGEKMGFGKSPYLYGSKYEETLSKLKAYKEGRRNVNGFGYVMKQQTIQLTDEQLEELARYIETFKEDQVL
jgi:cytochrome c553